MANTTALLQESDIQLADNGSEKRLYELSDGEHIETGSYLADGEKIICISTQVGCAVKCIFCATTFAGSKDTRTFIRNLSPEEIVEQVEQTLYNSELFKDFEGTILFSFMGMGEPALNANNVIEAIHRLGERYPESRATVATTGNNKKFFEILKGENFEIPVKIHGSLHAPDNETRKKLIPTIRRSVRDLLGDLANYQEEKNLPTKANYMLIEGLNDSEEKAVQLASLLNEFGVIVKISELNENPGIQLRRSTPEQRERFLKVLENEGVNIVKFESQGQDIKAGCGQMRRRSNEKKKC